MNLIDFILITIVAFSIYFGVKRGIFKTVVSLFGILLSFIVAGYINSFFSNLNMLSIIHSNKMFSWILFVTIFVFVFWLFSYFSKFVNFVGYFIISKLIDRFGGLIIGAVRGLVVCGVLVVLVASLDSNKTDFLGTSVIAPELLTALQKFFVLLR